MRYKEREMMPTRLTFVEPAPAQLQIWFTDACIGDECLIATHSREPIMSLTKAGLSLVWWSLPHVGRQGQGFSLSMPFTEVLQTWAVAQAF